ncbi:MAG: hypothetical protein J6Y85_03465 [Alphaproteobacteria bacterium]|nr:hypothetical protein [Alphaproteobacteria bacterium]
MKKYLFLIMCLLASGVAVAAEFECAYSPLQVRVAKARSRADIQDLIDKGINIEEETKCGGSLLQLAVRRGEPGVLAAILQQDQNRANSIEKLDAFPIPGVTTPIPLLLFAGYYAPNKEIVKLLLEAGANVAATDDKGRNVLWYMQYNPVLRNTDLYDQINERILYSLAKRSISASEVKPEDYRSNKLVMEK